MARFPVTALRSVDLVVADLGAAVEFYSRIWGLTLAERSATSAWLRATGGDAHVVALHAGEASAIRSMTLRVDPAADRDVLLARALAAGARLTHPFAPADDHGGGVIASIADRCDRTLRLVQHDAMVEPLSAAADRPERLAHVNINSDDVARDTAFFVEALGFALTDRSKMMAFVRTNDDHHSVVIADAPVNTLNHVAFQLPTWEGVMRAAGRMVDHQFPIGWGPGRHGPGDNVFTYFVDPAGFVVEYTAEVLQVDDSYRVGTPADWTWPAGRTDHWGIAPPKTTACKAAQLAIPFVR